MQTVLATPVFLKQADRAGVTAEELVDIVATIAADPLGGALMQGTGGARKMRHAGRGAWQERRIPDDPLFGGDDVPVFLLSVYGKGERAIFRKLKGTSWLFCSRRLLTTTGEKMTKFGNELIQSAHEALAIANGKLDPARTFDHEGVDVAAIRKKLNLSQDKFAKRFNLSASTVRDWEQKRRRPDRIAESLLRVIDHAPETVERALAADVGERSRA